MPILPNGTGVLTLGGRDPAADGAEPAAGAGGGAAVTGQEKWSVSACMCAHRMRAFEVRCVFMRGQAQADRNVAQLFALSWQSQECRRQAVAALVSALPLPQAP